MEKELINVVHYSKVMNKWMITRANSTFDYKSGNGENVKELFKTRNEALKYIKENFRSKEHRFYPKTYYWKRSGSFMPQGLCTFNWYSPSAYNL